MENEMETRVYMETTIAYIGLSIGITEKKMETTIGYIGLGLCRQKMDRLS